MNLPRFTALTFLGSYPFALALMVAQLPPGRVPLTYAANQNNVLLANFINGRMDVNGDGAITAADDSTDLLQDTDIIDGLLDCNAGPGVNGDGVIDANDDCTLVTERGTFISVVDGVFGRRESPSGAPAARFLYTGC